MSVINKQICGSWIDYNILCRAEERGVAELRCFGVSGITNKQQKLKYENYPFDDIQLVQSGLLSHQTKCGRM